MVIVRFPRVQIIFAPALFCFQKHSQTWQRFHGNSKQSSGNWGLTLGQEVEIIMLLIPI